MQFSLGPGQEQIQTQTLTPQLRQALNILQAPAMELQSIVAQELQNNPMLEELPISNQSIEAISNNEAEQSKDAPDAEMEFSDERALTQMSEDWNDYYADSQPAEYNNQAEERRQHFFDSLPSELTFYQQLLQQAQLDNPSEQLQEAFEFLVGSLDERGFLTSELDELSQISGHSIDLMEEALALLESLDPPGLGSKNLQECLLAQLKRSQKAESSSARIIRDHFDLLLRNRILDLSKALNLNLAEVQQALELISTLDPAPGRRFSEDQNQIVEPDITISQYQGEWKITLNRRYIPQLYLSPYYKSLLTQTNLKNQDHGYIRRKLQAGKFLIQAIDQRQNTLERIAKSILKRQKPFFEAGLSKLRPLTMAEVAKELDVHETSISRGVANKYISTPHGVFPLKNFFTAGYQDSKGEALANTSIKQKIADLITSEDPRRPYSDQKITNALKQEGIDIARRTVAKYREALGIPAASLRKKYQGTSGN